MSKVLQENLYSELDSILEQLTLGSPPHSSSLREAHYLDVAFANAERLLSSPADDKNRKRFELRLRLALHYSPSAAIVYERNAPTPRWELIKKHLITVYKRDEKFAESLARSIAVVLDRWDRTRSQVTAHKKYLIRRDGPYCKSCKISFTEGSKFITTSDPFKPYFESPEELQQIEVDHIEPISALGDNALENLQLLCRLCNHGKSDGLGVELRTEAKYAGYSVNKIPISHRAAMLYYVLARNQYKCSICQSESNELTVRLIVENGGYIRSNLYTICYNCLIH